MFFIITLGTIMNVQILELWGVEKMLTFNAMKFSAKFVSHNYLKQ
jgi:hypothetical protein